MRRRKVSRTLNVCNSREKFHYESPRSRNIFTTKAQRHQGNAEAGGLRIAVASSSLHCSIPWCLGGEKIQPCADEGASVFSVVKFSFVGRRMRQSWLKCGITSADHARRCRTHPSVGSR